ncbi:ABC transporter permease [Streptomyces sp. NPDC051976]|uniref:ABC transporter permease n=1 Tax=Streptomyces sp. NPDC051976 TaxID=3154947 RepID=UPI003415A382
MIALPIVGVSAADITIRSSQLSPQQKITRQIGAADARLSSSGYGSQPVYQSPDGQSVNPVKSNADQADSQSGNAKVDAATAAALPAGAHSITDDQAYVRFKTKYGLLDAPVRELKAADPLAAGIMDLTKGRYPAAPGEVMATNEFLRNADLHVGSRVQARDFDRDYVIVGAYDLPNELKTAQLNALPGTFLAAYTEALKRTGGHTYQEPLSYLVAVPGGFSWDMVKQANAKGVTVTSRAVLLHPPADADVPLYQTPDGRPNKYGSSSAERAAALAAAATVVGLAMLEICLLAGPAFAVGARRSRRQLGLVGANGGDRRHIRAVVLSGGLVIGAVAAVIGTVLGLLLTVVLRGTLENYVGKRFGGLTLRPAELVGIAALAVLTGLLAAIAPAFTASRQSVLASLTGRRGIRRANRVLPIVGLAAVLLGSGIAVFGALGTGTTLSVGIGSGVAELGVVALTPTLVGMFGRLGRWLPLSPRLALRDAVRNRGRTAPAVAAVLAAVAGTVAVATYAASSDRESRDAYQARSPMGVVSVTAYSDQGRDLGAIRAAIEKDYPVSGRADVSDLIAGKPNCDTDTGAVCGDVELQMPKANRCPLDDSAASDKLSVAQRRDLSRDWRCTRVNIPPPISVGSGVLVGGPAVLHALGIRDGDAEQALARGETVVFNKAYVDNGSLKVKIVTDNSKPVADGAEAVGPVKTVPVHLAAETVTQAYGVTAVMPAKAAAAAHINTTPIGSLFTTTRMPDSHERQALTGDLAKIASDAEVYLERGYTTQNNLVLLALSIFAGLVTVGAAGIATGLAQADAEPDLKTLAAIGAPPRVRRALSGFQCGAVAAMGVLLGSAAGILPAVGLRHTERRQEMKYYQQSVDSGFGAGPMLPHVPIVVPWGTLAALLVAVPLGATLLAALVTRSRSQLARRAEA